MQRLFPFSFADLGWVEFGWLILVFGGLSVLTGPGRRRWIGALVLALVFVFFGLLRARSIPDDMVGWVRHAPLWFSPLLVAGLVMLGTLRGALVSVVGDGQRLGWIWAGVTVAWSLALRPFDAGWGVWVLLAWILTAIVAAAQPPGVAPRAWIEKKGVGLFAAVALIVFCRHFEPGGLGTASAIAIVLLCWLLYAINAQGRAMRKYAARRLIEAPFVISVVVILSFVIMRAAPGGPFDQEKPLPPEIKAQLRARYNLDAPMYEQIRDYLEDVAWKGELGLSMKYKGKEVNEIIRTHVEPSAQLGAAALALALLIGVGAGLIAGIRQNSIFDYASMAVAMLGLALPTFVVGSFLVLIFALQLDWFAVSGWDDFPRDMILPAITLSLPFAARLARLTRAGMLEIVSQDYVRTARAKGLSEPMIVIRHTMKGTLLPVVSFLGPAVAQLLTGSLVVEKIFGVPGLGTEFVQAALNRDYTVAMGLVVLFGVLLVVFNLIVDIAYGFLDPRIRHA